MRRERRGLARRLRPGVDEGDPATDVDRAALETRPKARHGPGRVSLPDWPYGSLNLILFAEAAAAFEELTLAAACNSSKCRCPMRGRTCFGRPGSSRQSTSCRPTGSGAGRAEMARIFSRSTFGAVAARRDAHDLELTGHPSLTLRAGFVGRPSAQRLGAGPRASAAEVRAPRPSAARHHADRPPLRRGTLGASASRWSAHSEWRRAAAGVLEGGETPQPSAALQEVLGQEPQVWSHCFEMTSRARGRSLVQTRGVEDSGRNSTTLASVAHQARLRQDVKVWTPPAGDAGRRRELDDRERPAAHMRETRRKRVSSPRPARWARPR